MLSKLDDRKPTAFYWQLTLLATLGGSLIEVFPVTQNAISLAGVLCVFAGLCAAAVVFVWKFLPETKGLPVEEIVPVFERQQKKSVLPGGSEQAA